MTDPNRGQTGGEPWGSADASCFRTVFDALAPMLDTGRTITLEPTELTLRSSLRADDRAMDGWLVSTLVKVSAVAGADHAATLRTVLESGLIAHASVWGLTRGIIENLSTAVWILAEPQRAARQLKALRLHYYDYVEREAWAIAGGDEAAAGRAGVRRAQIAGHARALSLDEGLITSPMSFATVVSDAAVMVGRDGGSATAMWREASGFAHGRLWPMLNLGEPRAAEHRADSWDIAFTLNMDKLAPLAELAATLAERTVDLYRDQASDPPAETGSDSD